MFLIIFFIAYRVVAAIQVKLFALFAFSVNKFVGQWETSWKSLENYSNIMNFPPFCQSVPDVTSTTTKTNSSAADAVTKEDPKSCM